MPKHSRASLLFLLIFLSLNQLYAKEQIVVLQVNESLPIWSQNLPMGGMGSEIVQAISKEMGIKTRIEFIPLKRIIADTTNNDLGNPLFYMNNQEFAQIIPIAVSYNSFFAYNNDIDTILKNSQTTPIRIGIIKGTMAKFNARNKFTIFEESNSHKALFKKLKARRLDLVLELNLVGKVTTKKDKYFSSKILNRSGSAIAILIDRNYPNANEIALSYQKGLKRIINNGVYQKILDKYYTNNSTPPRWYNDLSKFTALYTIDSQGSD